MKHLIKIFDQAFSHEEYCGSKVGKNYSNKIIWDRSDDIKDGDIVFFTDSLLPHVKSISTNCVKVALLLEPPSVYDFSYKYVRENYSFFDYIITHQDSLSDLPNIVILPQWCSWIYPDKQKIYKKSKLLSIIASNKNTTVGQKMRHDIINYLNDKVDIDIYGGLTSNNSGYKPIVDKSEGFADYSFSIIVENSKSNFYFTEKIIDCLLTGTIPIYWGANNIGQYFDTRGFFIIDKIEDLDEIIPKINQITYDNMFDFVVKNFNTASEFLTLEDYIYENFLIKNNLIKCQ